MRQRLAELQRIGIEDKVYRSYGILSNCRRLTAGEAMELLSDMRLGYALEIFKSPPLSLSTYNVMMNIHPASLQKEAGCELSDEEALIKRAEYVRGIVQAI
jgi:protein arginine kinase